MDRGYKTREVEQAKKAVLGLSETPDDQTDRSKPPKIHEHTSPVLPVSAYKSACPEIKRAGGSWTQ